MLITQKLWERNYNLASLSLNTKFVQGIKNGDLPKTKFQEYLAQDYFFLGRSPFFIPWTNLVLGLSDARL